MSNKTNPIHLEDAYSAEVDKNRQLTAENLNLRMSLAQKESANAAMRIEAREAAALRWRQEARITELEAAVADALSAESEEMDREPNHVEWVQRGKHRYLKSGPEWEFDEVEDTVDTLESDAWAHWDAAAFLRQEIAREKAAPRPVDADFEHRAGWAHATGGKPYGTA